MSDINLVAVSREDLGKGASRRLRREGKVPAIVYGGPKNRKPTAITIQHKELVKATEEESFFSSVLNLEVDGKEEQVVLMDLQRHPAKPYLMHADFERITKTTIIHKTIPLHFLNEDKCVGVKLDGGILQHTENEVEVVCNASVLPEYIEIDTADLKVGDIIHLSDLKVPKGVELTALKHDDDKPICSVTKKVAPVADPEPGSVSASEPVPSKSDDDDDDDKEA